MSAFLAPLTPVPCGDDLSFSPEFDHIQELRRADDPTLDQGAWIAPLKSADWPAVVVQCDTLLANRTKDLRLMAWRVEALAQVEGLPGLARGLADCVRLCEAFWDGVHPLPEADDMAQRAGTFRWLLAQVKHLAYSLPVTAAPGGHFSLADIDSARQRQRPVDNEAAPAAGLSDAKAAAVQGACKDTPSSFLRGNVASLAEAQRQLQALQDLVDPRLGADSPSFVHARQALADAWHAVERIARDAGAIAGPHAGPRGRSPADAQQPAADAPSAPVAFASDAPAIAGVAMSRAQALRQLRDVAEYFRRTEPHSPVALLADKAARWGEMALEQWLREVVKDPGSLGHLEELLGLKPPPGAAA